MKRVLHLLSRSPAETAVWSRCLARIGEEDALLLTADAVYACHQNRWQIDLAGRRLFVLEPDLRARGLQVQGLSPQVQPVDYEGFVDLSVMFEQIVSW